MKRILIIAYYYPPNTSIASWRPHSWANYFSNEKTGGAEVHVVCRYWDGSEKTWEDQIDPSPNERLDVVKKSANLTIHYLPVLKGIKKVLNLTGRFTLLSKPFHFLLNLLHIHHIEVDGFYAFRKYIRRKFPKNYFDTVIVSSPPLNVVRLGYKLRKDFRNAFFVADFRDLWNNEIVNDKYRPGKKDRFFDKIYAGAIRKWTRQYDLVTSVSHALVDILYRIRQIDTAVITNGFERKIFAGLKKKDHYKFKITSIGTIYPHQEFILLANGIISFLRQNNFNADIQVEFIGTKSFNPELSRILEDSIPSRMLTLTDRIHRDEALQMTKDATILVYPGWPGYKGRYSGKIFEYLASGNNILIAPGDNDVIDELLINTKTGVSISKEEDIAKQLQQWYDEWKEKGAVTYNGLPGEIEKYSRESQAAKLSGKINEVRDSRREKNKEKSKITR